MDNKLWPVQHGNLAVIIEFEQFQGRGRLEAPGIEGVAEVAEGGRAHLLTWRGKPKTAALSGDSFPSQSRNLE